MFIDLIGRGRRGERWWGREREREERNIDVRKQHQSVASHMYPDQGLNSKPRYVP